MAKTVEKFAEELCDITDKITPLKQTVNDKNNLYQKIFEIFEQDAKNGNSGEFWEAVIDMKCKTQGKLKEVIERIMYKQSHQIWNEKTGIIKYVDVPSLLFLELLLHLIQQLKKISKPSHKFLKNFILVVEHSDTSGILNIGVDYLDFFLKITRENKKKLTTVIQAINNEFTQNGYKRSGNYSLAHIIRNYCNGLLGIVDADVDDAAAAAAAADADDWELLDVQDSYSDDQPRMTVEEAQKILHRPDLLPPASSAYAGFDRADAGFDRADAGFDRADAGFDTRPECKYGLECYQRNPEHLAKFKHSKGGAVSHSTKIRIKRRTKRRRRHTTRRRRTKHRRH